MRVLIYILKSLTSLINSSFCLVINSTYLFPYEMRDSNFLTSAYNLSLSTISLLSDSLTFSNSPTNMMYSPSRSLAFIMFYCMDALCSPKSLIVSVNLSFSSRYWDNNSWICLIFSSFSILSNLIY